MGSKYLLVHQMDFTSLFNSLDPFRGAFSTVNSLTKALEPLHASVAAGASLAKAMEPLHASVAAGASLAKAMEPLHASVAAGASLAKAMEPVYGISNMSAAAKVIDVFGADKMPAAARVIDMLGTDKTPAAARLINVLGAGNVSAAASVIDGLNAGKTSAAVRMVDMLDNVISTTAGIKLDFGHSIWRHGNSVDILAILDPGASRNAVARSIDLIIESIASVARNADVLDVEDATPDAPTDRSARQDGRRVTKESRLWTPESASGAGVHQDAGYDDFPGEAIDPVTVFCGSADVDKQHRDALIKHLWALRSSGVIKTWHEGDITAGDNREASIWQNLDLARLILLLISADYLNHLWENNMLRRIEARARARKAIIVPVLVRPTYAEGTLVERLPSLPSNGIPVTTWVNSDEAWVDVARGVREVVASIRRASARYH
ncbi:TIR domain-containing protein [Sorangium sp. So ce295]|uniref:TIR domain-containing protein n=1 Tax=Sorangium sp. So ce295 TaxID=3133295 RepID=UPI003F630548